MAERESFLPNLVDKKPPFRRCCFITTIVMSAVFIFILIVGIVLSVLAAGPLHASCKVSWKIGANCSQVEERLISQMKVWHTKDNCAVGGQRCLYTYVKTKDNTVYGTHETPVKHYVDDLSFELTSSTDTTCSVEGNSRSQVWYAVLDYGTNYCNLHNLVEGARLNETTGYSEMTSDSQCTQYSSADCDVY